MVRVLTTLCAGNRVILRAEEEQTLFDEMCAVIVDSGYLCAGVVIAMFDERKSLR